VDDQNQRVSGKVKSLSRTNDGTVLTLTTGERLFMSNIDSITDSTTTPPPPTDPPPPNLNPKTPASPGGNLPNDGPTPGAPH